MDRNPENDSANDSRNSPLRKASKRLKTTNTKLAALRRSSAGSTSLIQPSLDSSSIDDLLTNTPTTSMDDPTIPLDDPTMSADPSVVSNNPTSVQPSPLSVPSVAPTAHTLNDLASPPTMLATISDDLVNQIGIQPLQKRFVHPAEKIPLLTKNPSRALVMTITTNLLSRDCPYTFHEVVPHAIVPSLETLLQQNHAYDRVARKACLQWPTWTVEQFCYELRKAVPDIAVARPHSAVSFYELIAKLPIQFDVENDALELVVDSKLQAICAKFPDVTQEDELKAAKLLILDFPSSQSIGVQFFSETAKVRRYPSKPLKTSDSSGGTN